MAILDYHKHGLMKIKQQEFYSVVAEVSNERRHGRVNTAKFPFRLLLVALGIFTTQFVCSDERQTKNVTISVGEWAPYLGEDEPGYGVAGQIISDAFKAMGFYPRFEFFPWARSYQVAKAGLNDSSAIWFRTKDRESDFLFSLPVIQSKEVFFYLKSKAPIWKSLNDLNGWDIGGTIAYFYGDAFTRAEKQKVIHVERTDTDESNFKKLLLGRIQLFPCDELVGWSIIKREFKAADASRFASSRIVLVDQPLYLIASKENPKSAELIRVFNEGLSRIKTNGTYGRTIGLLTSVADRLSVQ